jgi:hypothetical protein
MRSAARSGNGDRRGVGVSSRCLGHYGRVHNAQTLHSAYPQLGVAYCLRITAHGGSPRRVEHRPGRGTDPFPDLLIVIHIRTGHHLTGRDAGKRLALGDLAGDANSCHQNIEVGFVTEVGRIDNRLRVRIGGAQRYASTAPHLDCAHEGADRSFRGRTELGERRRPRDGTELQIWCHAIAEAAAKASEIGAKLRHWTAPLALPKVQVLGGDLFP